MTIRGAAGLARIVLGAAGVVAGDRFGYGIGKSAVRYADSRIRSAQDIGDVLSQLECDGLVESIAALRVG